MMQRLMSWLRLRRSLNARERADRWMKEAGRAARHLDKKWKKLQGIKRLFEETSADCEGPIEEAKYLLSQYEPTIEGLRNELQIKDEIVIPTLTASHRLLLERVMAEIEAQIRRQVSLRVKEE